MAGELERRSYALFAISYDTVAQLKDFADTQGITYPLLSDEGSSVIESVGVLDRHLAQHHAVFNVPTSDEQRGVAYPMTFVLDAEGRIERKIVEENYRLRYGAAWLVASLTGEVPPLESVVARTQNPLVGAFARLDAPRWYPYQRLGLHLRLGIADGWHVYGPAVPAGYTPLRVHVASTPPGVRVERIAWPATKPFTVQGLGEGFEVYGGTVEIALPLTFALNRDAGVVRLDVRVEHQACSETECLPPAVLSISLEVPEQPAVPR